MSRISKTYEVLGRIVDILVIVLPLSIIVEQCYLIYYSTLNFAVVSIGDDLPFWKMVTNVQFWNDTHRLQLGINALIALLGLLLGIFILWFVRNYKIHYRTLDYSLTRKETLTKSKLHNIRTNYNEISNLIFKEDWQKAKEYIDLSAYYLSLSLNSEGITWTVKDEEALLIAFYNAESIVKSKVELKVTYLGFVAEKTLFPADVLTTLLDNSMRHGFKRGERQWIFHVDFFLDNDILYCTVKDNGNPSPKESYIKENKPNKGLSILKSRIQNEFRIKNLRKEKFNYQTLTVETGNDYGTTIKFTLPYETTT